MIQGRFGWKIYDGDSGVMNGEKMRLKIYCISLSRLICCKSSFFITTSELRNGRFRSLFYFCSNFVLPFPTVLPAWPRYTSANQFIHTPFHLSFQSFSYIQLNGKIYICGKSITPHTSVYLAIHPCQSIATYGPCERLAVKSGSHDNKMGEVA